MDLVAGIISTGERLAAQPQAFIFVLVVALSAIVASIILYRLRELKAHNLHCNADMIELTSILLDAVSILGSYSGGKRDATKADDVRARAIALLKLQRERASKAVEKR